MSGSRRIPLSDSERPAAASARCRKPVRRAVGPDRERVQVVAAASGVALSNAIEKPVSRRPRRQLSPICATVAARATVSSRPRTSSAR